MGSLKDFWRFGLVLAVITFIYDLFIAPSFSAGLSTGEIVSSAIFGGLILSFIGFFLVFSLGLGKNIKKFGLKVIAVTGLGILGIFFVGIAIGDVTISEFPKLFDFFTPGPIHFNAVAILGSLFLSSIPQVKKFIRL